MKIYTKTGDTGDTGLFGGGRVGKEDSRVEAYGQVDELNSVLGMARAEGLGTLDPLVESLQSQLFTIGALLATPRESQAAAHVAHVQESWITAMERAIEDLKDREELRVAGRVAFLGNWSSALACLI